MKCKIIVYLARKSNLNVLNYKVSFKGLGRLNWKLDFIKKLVNVECSVKIFY